LSFYKLLEHIPSTREFAQRLDLVTLKQMANALIHAVENPPGEKRQNRGSNESALTPEFSIFSLTKTPCRKEERNLTEPNKLRHCNPMRPEKRE
jgi:hypothetical protein